jgi:hypothetical protein
MPPKSIDKGKAPQRKLESPKQPSPSKFLCSAISSAKPIKSWIDIVIEKEVANYSS